MLQALAVIPARFASTRFPGKPLAPLLGRAMVLHVADRCREAGCFARVVVATDDARIADVVRGAGVEVAMTSPDCATGTDRVAEVAKAAGLGGEEVIINVQGDEPALPPGSLRTLVGLFEDATVQMATLVRPLRSEERSNPNVVKAVLDERHQALYFSRADLPFTRDAEGAGLQRWAHVGLYGYRARTVARLAALPPTALEKTEALEQLRALGHGLRIACGVVAGTTQAVDRPEDVALAEAALRVLARG